MPAETVFDPLRKRMVALTPEEGVRQWLISFLHTGMKVPRHMMMSEVALNYGDGPVQKTYRADIVVYDRSLGPLLIAECKRPEVQLTGEVVEQALRYTMVLGARYIMISNGTKTFLMRRNGNEWKYISSVPTYEEMMEAK